MVNHYRETTRHFLILMVPGWLPKLSCSFSQYDRWLALDPKILHPGCLQLLEIQEIPEI